MNCLKVQGVGHWYQGEAPLFSNLSFEIAPQTFTFISGENGRGKSTLLKILAQKLKPKAGVISNGFTELETGWLPQLESLFFYIPLRLGDLLAEAPRTSLTLGIDLSKNWNEASGGERKRTLLEKVLSEKKKLLLLDEPFNHLDATGKIALLDRLVLSQKETGMAIVLVSHEEKSLLRGHITQEVSW